MNIENAKTELDRAEAMRCKRAAFGSIIRRNHNEIKRMSADSKRQLLRKLSVSKNYYPELQKELARVEYDIRHGH